MPVAKQLLKSNLNRNGITSFAEYESSEVEEVTLVTVGAVSSAVVKLRDVVSLIPAYELLEESSKAVAAIWT